MRQPRCIVRPNPKCMSKKNKTIYTGAFKPVTPFVFAEIPMPQLVLLLELPLLVVLLQISDQYLAYILTNRFERIQFTDQTRAAQRKLQTHARSSNNSRAMRCYRLVSECMRFATPGLVGAPLSSKRSCFSFASLKFEIATTL